MIDFLKNTWQRWFGENDPPLPPAGWDGGPATALLLRLREEPALRAKLGVAEAKALLGAFQQGFGLEHRAGLEQLLAMLLVKTAADQEALGRALDDFQLTRARAYWQQAEAARQAAVPKPGTTTPADLALPQEPPTPTPPPPTPPRPVPSTPAYQSNIQLELSLSTGASTALPDLPESAAPADASLPPQGHRFIFTDDYQPVSPRQMDQIWRFLRKPSRTGGRTDELDLPRTVERLARQGWLDRPEWQRDKFNKVHLVLLLDHGGSMLAWQSLARQLAASALGGGGHRAAEIFWFHNLPQQFESAQQSGLLFRDPGHLRSEKMEKLLQRCSKQNTEVLIFSDAGAARGHHNPARIEQTRLWLQLWKRHVSTVAWLNPMPAARWWGSSAEWISHQAGMFESTPRGLMDAVNHLRGR